MRVYCISSNLKTHIDSKHEGVRYPCSQCEFLATTASYLKVHVQCVSEPPRGRVSAELSKPVERKGAMCVVLV